MAGRVRTGDLVAYQTKHDAFLRELRQFHSSRGTAFNRPPRINGRDVDLYLLYSEVTSLGGWKKVNNTKSWPTVLELLHIPKECPNATFAIRHFYIRYLDQYERIHFHGEESDDDRVETTDIRGRKNYGTSLHMPTSYNHQQHELTDAMRLHLGLSAEGVYQSEYDKLVFSLLSGLPNEVDFAINVCTLLANDSRRGLHLERCPRLLELLIAQAGVWSDSNVGIRCLLEDEWKRLEGTWSMATFWRETLADKEIGELLGPWEGKGESEKADDDEDSLFNINRQLGIRDREGQRVLQIAAILRNLSFEDSNVPILASSSVCLKFLLLCAHCNWANLRQLAFDTLGNLTTEMVLDPSDDLSTQILFKTITKSLQSNDRFLIMRGLEMLIGLCQVENNEDAIVKSLENKVYERICALLTIPDIMLLVYTLECLYHVTQLGKEPCNVIAQIHGIISVLIGLASLEAQTFGPNACISMKLVESPALCAPVSFTPTNTPRPVITTPQRIITSHGQRSISIPIPPGYQELDNETFVCNWLKATYEPRSNHFITHNTIYNEYQGVCIRLGKKGLIGPTQLANHLRAVFPQVIQKKSEGSTSIDWEGLKKRDHPLAVSIITPIKTTPKVASNLSQPLPELTIGKVSVTPGSAANSSHSPILKAQLSAPPKSPVLRQHPHLHKALVTSPNPSPPPSVSSPIKESSISQTPTTLIKSLLANKVSQNIQRQQQQQILKSMTVPTTLASSPEKTHCVQPPLVPQLLLTVASVTTTAVTSATVTSTANTTSPEAKTETCGISSVTNNNNGNNSVSNNNSGGNLRPIAAKIEPRLALFCPKLRLNGAQRLTNSNSVDRGKTITDGMKNGGTEPSKTTEVVSTTTTSVTPPSIFKCQQLTNAQNSGNNPFATLPPNLQPSQPPVNRKGGVLADLLDGKVNKDALLVMNGVIDRRPIVPATSSPSLTATTALRMTNGEGPTAHSTVPLLGGGAVEERSANAVSKDNGQVKTANEVKLGSGIVRTVVNRFTSMTPDSQLKGRDDLIGYPRVSYEQLKQLNQKSSTIAVVKRPLIVKSVSQVSSTVGDGCSAGSINSDGLEVKRLKLETPCNTTSTVSSDKKPIVTSSTLVVNRITPVVNTATTTTPTKVVPLTGVGQQLQKQQLQKQQQSPQLQSLSQPLQSPVRTTLQVQQQRPPVTPRLEFICEWKDCKKTFDTPNSVYFHVCKVHTPVNGPTAGPCLWENCDQMIRQRLSLMTHIQERHCNEGVLRLQARRRQEMSSSGQSSIPNPPPPPPHPGYAPNAAFHAIKRHALEFLNHKELTEEEKEGPVTKCIRLTAVLVLRNLSRNSSTGRRLIQRHEELLASIAISNVEASGTASHCLAYLTFPPKEVSQVSR